MPVLIEHFPNKIWTVFYKSKCGSRPNFCKKKKKNVLVGHCKAKGKKANTVF